jgi:hypothetical protein
MQKPGSISAEGKGYTDLLEAAATGMKATALRTSSSSVIPAAIRQE